MKQTQYEIYKETIKNYYYNNKQSILHYHKIYYQENKQRIKHQIYTNRHRKTISKSHHVDLSLSFREMIENN